MKKYLLLTATFGLTLFTQAQITITQNDFAQVGDTIYYAYDTVGVTSNIGAASGANKSWDISNAGKDEVKASVFLSTANSPIPAPTNITHVLVDGDVSKTRFLNISSTQLETVIPNPAVTFLGGESFIRLKSVVFPSTYLTQVADTFFSSQVLPGASLGLSAIADSVKITFTIKVSSKGDAWGDLKTPTGTYPSLRFKISQTVDFKLEGKRKLGPIWTPWIAIPAGSLPVALPSNETTISYAWVHQNGKYFLAEETMVAGNPTKREKLRYQTPKPVVNTGIANQALNNIKAVVYPNPANDELFIDTKLNTNQSYQLNITDITGKLIQSTNIIGDGNTIKLTTNNLNNGLYFVNLIGSDSKVTVKFAISR